MAPQVTASPGEVKSAAPLPSPTLPPSAPSLVKRAGHALTTPYVFPPECALTYKMTSKTGFIASEDYYGAGYGKVEEEYLWHDMRNNQHWSSCQPTGEVTGYNKKVGYQTASSVFRGAVCPSGWMAFEVGLASHTLTTPIYGKGYATLPAETWSTAHCCRSGDVYDKNYWSIDFTDLGLGQIDHTSICISRSRSQPGYSPEGTIYSSYVVHGKTYFPAYGYTNTVINSYRSGTTTTETNTGIYTPVQYTQLTLPWTAGRAFYAAMSMEWFEEDNETLSPKWPTLTSDMLIPTWTPGETVNNKYGNLDNRGTGKRAAPPPSMPNKIAIPVIATLATLLGICLGALLFLLWRGRRGKRQAKGSHKIVEDQHLGIPVGAEGGSTAHLNGQAGDEMELREREVAR